jgi:hypothetical protein
MGCRVVTRREVVGTRFQKARFHVAMGPRSLFDRVRFKMRGKRTLRIHASHLASRAIERVAPLEAIAAFDSSEWELVTAEVRADTGKFINSAWRRAIEGRWWWVAIGLYDAVETVIDTDKLGLGDSIVTAGDLFDLVERINRELMLAEGEGADGWT